MNCYLVCYKFFNGFYGEQYVYAANRLAAMLLVTDPYNLEEIANIECYRISS